MDSISHEEPGCSHDPEINIPDEEKKIFSVKELVTCVLKPQAETATSKEMALQFTENRGINNFPDTNETSKQHLELNNNESNTSKEIAIHEPQTESTIITQTENDEVSVKIGLPPYLSDNLIKRAPRQHSHIPLLLISRPPSLIADQKRVDPITTQPRPMPVLPTLNSAQLTNSNLTSHSPTTVIPPSLFLLALSKINQSNVSLNLLNQLQELVKNSSDVRTRNILTEREISAPSSINESAPPSYSFVLRQNSRRPQLMGTFIPSPSFIPLTPPPNYAAAFDIYVDNGVPPPRPRTINYGFTPMPVVCHICGFAGISVTHSKITLCTHLCAVLMCLFCCWLCVPLPYLLNSCKDVYHYCGNCRNYLGMYCPTNPESSPTFA